MADKTYTQEEQDALLAQVADLTAKVAEMTDATTASLIETKVAEVTAAMDAAIAEVQAKLDTAVLEAETAKTAHDEIVAFLDAAVADTAAKVEMEARKEERLAKVREVASFPEEYLTENADRFAAMSDEAFTAAVEDWAAIAPQKSASGTKEELPKKTAMSASRAEGANPLTEIMGLRFSGVDTRTV